MDAKRIKPGDYWIDDEGARWMATEDHPDSEGYYPVISIDGMIPDGIVLDAIPSNRINLLAAAQRLGGPLTPWVRRCAELERLLRVARSFLPLCIFQSEGTDMAVVIDEIDAALGKEENDGCNTT